MIARWRSRRTPLGRNLPRNFLSSLSRGSAGFRGSGGFVAAAASLGSAFASPLASFFAIAISLTFLDEARAVAWDPRGASLARCGQCKPSPPPMTRTGTGPFARRGRAGSREQLADHLALDIGQAEVAPLEAIGQLRVLQAEQVQDGRLEVVDVDPVLDGRETELVGGPQGQARPRPAAGDPHRRGVDVMVAADRLPH